MWYVWPVEKNVTYFLEHNSSHNHKNLDKETMGDIHHGLYCRPRQTSVGSGAIRVLVTSWAMVDTLGLVFYKPGGLLGASKDDPSK
jgi:hypothetical protein